jgi:hypothetical protein
VQETACSGRRTSTFSTSCFLTASISSILVGSEPSLYSRASSTHEPPTRPNLHVGACPNRQRDAPPSSAPASPPAGRHAQRAKRPRIRQEPPRQAAARRTSGTASPGSPPQQEARFHLDGPRCPISPRPPTEGSGPGLGPCARPNPEAEAKAEAESRRGPWLLRAKSSDPHINRVLTACGTCSPCGGNTRGSQTHGLAYVGANPRRPQCRAHATRFGQRRLRFAWIESDAASGPAAQQRSAGCSV